ncbi:MAG: hypothetical protein ACKO85_07515, partial [Isosphaeraceae bacterium]
LLEDMEQISMSGLTFAQKADGEKNMSAAAVVTPVVLPVKQLAAPMPSTSGPAETRSVAP